VVRVLRAVGLFVTLLLFWQALSARIDPLFIALGVVSALLATAFSLRLLEDVLGPATDTPRIHVPYLLWFLVWLLWQIPPAGFQVASVVLDPRRPPRPGVVRFRTNLRSPAAKTLLANAITLVPGTMTLSVEGDEFTVHAFTPDTTADLADGSMQTRIARAFRQPDEPPPQMIWEPIHDELPEDPGT
jgi:multicomponent Na+:H+ antiporter subunit E